MVSARGSSERFRIGFRYRLPPGKTPRIVLWRELEAYRKGSQFTSGSFPRPVVLFGQQVNEGYANGPVNKLTCVTNLQSLRSKVKVTDTLL